MVLGINTLRDAFSGKPDLDGPSRLPDYFPIEPRGCEKHAQKLFTCLADGATAKAREMEKAGLHKSYYPNVVTTPGDENAAKAARDAAEEVKRTGGRDLLKEKLPTVDDNPLDECRSFIAYYKRCCDRELRKSKNWILTEPYRVQEEYRYKKN